jgi:hypothetical protein
MPTRRSKRGLRHCGAFGKSILAEDEIPPRTRAARRIGGSLGPEVPADPDAGFTIPPPV